MSNLDNDFYVPYTPYLNEDEKILDSSYNSDSDNDSDNGSYYSGSQSMGSAASVGEPPDPKQLYTLAGPLNPDNLDKFRNEDYYEFDLSGVKKDGSILNFKETKFTTSLKQSTYLVNVDSRDRDRTAYPQPTNFNLYLPRTYKNITQLQFTQIKLLSAFLYFRDDKYNTFFNVYEHDRTVLGTNDPLNILVKIREGSYDINSLLNELTTQMNTTPPFFYYPGGINQFISVFTVNGDLGLNFNQPGDYYYDSLNDQYITNPTMDQIISKYFSSRYAGLITYTYDNCLIAYYYPVLKEAFLDPNEINNLYTISTIPGYETFTAVYDRVVYNYQGLSDDVVLQLIKNNINELDKYRTHRSFVENLINKYTWGVQPFNNRVYVNSNTLNTSITKDISRQQTTYLATALSQAGLSLSGYTSTNAGTILDSALLTALYTYLQTQLATYFGINYGSFSLPLMANPSTIMNIQNGADVSGVFTAFSASFSQALSNGDIVIDPNYNFTPSSPTTYFPNLLMSTPTFDISNVNNVGSLKNHPYDFTLKDILDDTTFIDSSGNIYINPKDRSGSTVAYISSGQYSIFKFRSDVRQTLQVETLPLPFYYRYPDYNSQFGGNIPYYFNQSYRFTDISLADIPLVSTNIITLSSITYGIDLSSAKTPGSGQPILATTLNVITPVKYIEFTTPLPSTIGVDISFYKYPLNLHLEISGSGVGISGDSFTYAIYHDRAAFMADASTNSVNMYNMIANTTFSSADAVVATTGTGLGKTDISLNVIADNKYYILLKSNQTAFSDLPLNLYIYWDISFALTNIYWNLSGDTSQGLEYPYQNPILALSNLSTNTNLGFTKTNDIAWQHLPSNSSLFPPNPNDVQFNTVYPSDAPIMGYDVSGISTDLTDYKGWTNGSTLNNPTAQYRIDPMNQYKFQNITGYSTTYQQYIYPGTSNSILNASTNTPYTARFLSTQQREYKIVHWYDTHYICPQIDDTGFDICGMPTLSTMAAYDTSAAIIGGYTYASVSGFTRNTLKLGNGVYGISFLPSDGWWDVQRFQFKSAYCKPGGPNDRIAYIGIFDTHAILHNSITTIDLSAAYTVLSSSRTTYYSTTTQVVANGGFDPTLGAYYEYTAISTNNYLNAEGYSGYTPYPSTIINKEQAFYSAVAFDSSRNPMPFFMLTGSLVPYPEASTPTISGNYLGVVPPPVGGIQHELIVPTPSGPQLSYVNNIYQSQYEKSIPIGTQLLHYKTQINVFNDIGALTEYDLYLNGTGETTYRLRTAWYQRGGYQYLTAGSIDGTLPFLGDIYQIRNPGTSYKDIVFIQHFDTRKLLPSSTPINYWSTDTSNIYILSIPSSTWSFYTYSNIVDDLSGGSATTSYTLDTSLLSVTFDSSSSFMVCYNNSAELCTVIKCKNGPYVCILLIVRRGGVNYISTRTITGTYTFIDYSVNPSNPNSYCLLYKDISNNYYKDIIQYDVASPTLIGGQWYGSEIILSNTLVTSSYITQLDNIYMGISGSELSVYGWSSQQPNRLLLLQPIIESSQFTIPSATYGLSIAIDVRGGIWIQEQVGTFFDEDPWRIYGNSQLGTETSYGLTTAWQIFYPTIKITLTKRANMYNNITNLNEINYYNKYGLYFNGSNPNYPTYEHTQMFLYRDLSSLMMDLSGLAGWKWGREQQYMRADISFSGYYFNSYIFNGTLDKSPPLTSDNDYYYLAIRGYMPSENFATMVRFRMSQRYDFGFMTMPQLINEICGSSIASLTGTEALYNPEYSRTIASFNNAFILPVFSPGGSMSLVNLPDISFTGFNQYYSTFTTTYNRYITNKSTITGINDYVRSQTENYISTFYSGIIPASQLSKSNLTSAIKFDLLFKSSIPSQIQNADQFWGLGYNLGYPKQDLSTFVPPLETNYCRVKYGMTREEALGQFGGGGTSYIANSFYKILEDYIYLKLNDEYSLNRVDSSSREYLDRTLDTQGQTNQYYAKLLLSNFGTYAQVMIQNPVVLNPPISKLDKIKFSWVDSVGNIISNNDCEWSGILQITETSEVANPASTLPQTTVTTDSGSGGAQAK